MSWKLFHPPDPHEFDAIARAVFDAMPVEFRRMCEGVVIHTQEFADPETLHHMGIDDKWGLLGLYHGVNLMHKSVMHAPQQPDMVFLYRQPILQYTRAQGEDIRRVIAHVLIHEIGHHFGFSDEDMHFIEDEG